MNNIYQGYRSSRRGSMVFFLYILLLVMVEFFAIKPTEPLTSDWVVLPSLFVVLFMIMWQGRHRVKTPPISWFDIKPMVLLLLGIFISFFPAKLYYDQSFIQSFLTYRKGVFFLILPALLMARPSASEIRHALYLFAITWFIVAVAVTFYYPDWIIVSEDDFTDTDRSDLLVNIPGGRFLCLAFIFAFDQVHQKGRIQDFIIMGVLFFFLFLYSNRTILLSSLIIIIYGVFSNRQLSRKILSGGLVLIFFVLFFVLAAAYIQAWIKETISQLGDMDYNRVKAYMYVFSGVNGWFSYIWGNGFISIDASTLMKDLAKEGIFHSDIGILGMWNQFGILTALVLLVSSARGLSRHHSFLVTANALFILSGSPTLSYFFLYESIFWICLYWYIFAMDKDYYLASRKQAREMKARRIRRYRSIGGG